MDSFRAISLIALMGFVRFALRTRSFAQDWIIFKFNLNKRYINSALFIINNNLLDNLYFIYIRIYSYNNKRISINSINILKARMSRS